MTLDLASAFTTLAAMDAEASAEREAVRIAGRIARGELPMNACPECGGGTSEIYHCRRDGCPCAVREHRAAAVSVVL